MATHVVVPQRQSVSLYGSTESTGQFSSFQQDSIVSPNFGVPQGEMVSPMNTSRAEA